MKKYSDLEGDGGSGIVEQVAEMAAGVNRRMEKIRHQVAIVSGKGGVGKSVVTANIAATMAGNGYRVGVLDADINGSSIPHLLGVKESEPERGKDGISPLTGINGIKVMSIDFMLDGREGPAQSHTWIGPIEATALRELLADTEWGELDYLFIDTPPVLSRVNDLSGFLPGLSGALLVTIPSEISYKIVLKTIARVKELGIPIIGLVENMKGYACVHCGGHNKLFEGDDMKEAISYMVPYLGAIPFADSSRLVEDAAAGPLHEAFVGICEKAFGDAARKKSNEGEMR